MTVRTISERAADGRSPTVDDTTRGVLISAAVKTEGELVLLPAC